MTAGTVSERASAPEVKAVRMTLEAVATQGLSDLGLPGGALIAGQWQREGLTLPVHDPHDGTVVASVADNDAAVVHSAVTAVAEAVAEPALAGSETWPLWQRRETLEGASRLVAEHTDRIARIINAESGKTLSDARREVGRCVETLRLCAAATGVLRGETLEFDDSARGQGHRGWFARRPIGVVAAITPFNDPLNLVAHKIGPALLAGNGVVLKPAQTTPLSALALVDLLLTAGVPVRRIAVVCGGAATGAALVAHPGVDLISFTGGPATAARIAADAGPKKLLMELGGNNPTIVRADADLDAAAAALVDGAFGCAGQNCLSVQRIYAHESIYAPLLERIVAVTRKLRVGSAVDRDGDIGPMITEAEAARVQAWVDRAVAAGAVLHAGGRRSGAFHEPTVLTDVPGDAEVLTHEIFGPVVTLAPYRTDDEAVAAANASAYALQAGVFTAAIDDALDIADRLLAGAVVINGTSDLRIDAMPFGGFKGSGIGREGVRFAVEAMSEPKCTIIHRRTVTRC